MTSVQDMQRMQRLQYIFIFKVQGIESSQRLIFALCIMHAYRKDFWQSRQSFQPCLHAMFEMAALVQSNVDINDMAWGTAEGLLSDLNFWHQRPLAVQTLDYACKNVIPLPPLAHMLSYYLGEITRAALLHVSLVASQLSWQDCDRTARFAPCPLSTPPAHATCRDVMIRSSHPGSQRLGMQSAQLWDWLRW